MKRTSFPYIAQMIAPATAARTIHTERIPGVTPRRCSSGPIPEGSVIGDLPLPLRVSIGSCIAAVFKGCCNARQEHEIAGSQISYHANKHRPTGYFTFRGQPNPSATSQVG
jgi:hypothetical protein